MRRFELVEGKSSKFWQIDQDGSDLDIRWGRIGTNGQSQTKSFADDAAASAAAKKLIDAKTSKGYAEVDATGVATPAKPAAESTPKAAPKAAKAATSTAAKATADAGTTAEAAEAAGKDLPEPAAQPPAEPTPEPATDGADTGRAPWADRPYDLAGLDEAQPSRRFPRPDQPAVPELSWQEIVGGYSSRMIIDPDQGHWTSTLNELLAVRAGQNESPSRQAQALILGIGLSLGGAYSTADAEHGLGTRALIAKLGLPAAVDVLLDSLGSLSVRSEYKGQVGDSVRYALLVDDEVTSGTGGEYLGVAPGHTAAQFRDALTTAPDAEYTECVARVRAAFGGLSPARRLLLAMLLPDEPEFSDELGRELIAKTAALPDRVPAQPLVRSAMDPAVIRHVSRDNPEYVTVWRYPEFCNTLLREFGADAVPRLAPGAREEAAGAALTAIGTPEAVAALIDVANSSKGALARLTEAVHRWPEAGVAALAKAVASGGRDVTLTEPLLTRLVSDQPELLPRVRPYVDGAARAVLDRVAEKLAGPTEVADVADLPAVLASPPWLGRRTTVTVPEVAGLEPVPLPDEEVWPDGVREERSLNEWELQRAGGYRKQPETALRDFLECRHSAQPTIAAALQQAREAAGRGDAEGFVAAWREHLRLEQDLQQWSWHAMNGSQIAHLPNGIGVEVWNSLAGESTDYLWAIEYATVTLGLAGLPGTVRIVQRRPTDYAKVALPFRTVRFAPVMARCLVKLKTAREDGRAWLLAHPEHAVAGLIPDALAKKGEAKDCAIAALRFLAEEGHRDLVTEMAARYGRDDVAAGVQAVLDLDPLQQLPSRIPALPAWWQPRTWTRPCLTDGRALPDAALDALGVMFALPRGQGLYPGIEPALQACEPASLAGFGWDMFSAWLAAGAPSKESWALSTLALLGDDDTARRLTPLLRAWPGESQHARAVAGLDVLAGIGTDLALMQLNGIAQKLKFKGLQDKAREKIAQIAEDRQMTTEELADRLAPDLGLDERGTLTLDFGPRRFTVGFDEALAPFVRDGDGARLKDLPKPRASDDAAAAKEATTTWRQLKKDARTISAQQVFRFELAMTNRRRWTPDVFTELIVTHPLVGHVARRLVWGLFDPDPDTPTLGGTLTGVFRVAEDNTFTDAHDEPVDLPEGRVIGVVHALELTPQDAAAIGQVFADYEIAQPFPQLGRDTYTLTDTEHGATELTRWKTRPFPTAKLLGLTNRGWRRGTPQDAGWVGEYTRDLGDGRLAQFNLDPGVVVGAPEFEPVQTGVTLVVGTPRWEEVAEAEPFGSLHPVTASELIREAEILTQPADS